MKRILVGLSGGVDSAVTVYLLKRNGYIVTGVFLDMLGDSSGEEWRRVKILAEQLNIKLIRKNVQKIFEKEIIEKFVDSYKKGLTPNPCVLCNPQIKFKYLLEIANELGIRKIATGHYARIDNDVDKILKKAVDKTKDQSYFLYGLTVNELRRIEFPLGLLQKAEVKKIAQKNKLKIPKLESQDVCFLKNFKNLEEFLKKRLTHEKERFKSGKIIDDTGIAIGKHSGLLIYTLGQRRGLNIGGDGPFYVIGKDFKKNELLVSRDRNSKKILHSKIIINKTNWISEKPEKTKKYQIKIRYQMKSVRAKLKKIEDKKWQVECVDSVWAVTSGQSLVVYDKDKVVGGGVIN